MDFDTIEINLVLLVLADKIGNRLCSSLFRKFYHCLSWMTKVDENQNESEVKPANNLTIRKQAVAELCQAQPYLVQRKCKIN